MQKVNQENIQSNCTLEFIKELAKYYMDFLETDFHKSRTPKRTITITNNENLLVGINLAKHQSFRNNIWKAITHNFDNSNKIRITKSNGTYLNKDNNFNLNENLIENKINDIIRTLNKKLFKILELDTNNKSHDFDYFYETLEKVISEQLILPTIEEYKNLKVVDENEESLINAELTSIILDSSEDQISEIIKTKNNYNNFNISEDENLFLEPEKIILIIKNYLNNYNELNLFRKFNEINKNKAILEKQEYYLYFCDIKYNKINYPIFYIPISINNINNELYIEFDPKVYINKKALEYIIQSYNGKIKKNSNDLNDKNGEVNEEEKITSQLVIVKSISERIIYLAQDSILELGNKILSEISNNFNLNCTIDLKLCSFQKAKSIKNDIIADNEIVISNNCYIALFDKSDETLVNDYEEILKLLSSDDSLIKESFNQLITDFIYNEPINFIDEVEQEWNSTCISQRLVFNSPIPLNSEQLQILLAIKKEACKYVTVEGPPGTGKSHTITAIAFEMILKNKSILILSDKKEALDVVEEKITETMNKVRNDNNFQNPILRLGRTGSTYSQILSNNSFSKIKMQYNALSNEYNTLKDKIGKNTKNLIKEIESEISIYEKIKTEDIEEVISNENKNTIVLDKIISENITPEILKLIIDIVQDIKQMLDINSTKSVPHNVKNIKLKINELQTIDELKNFLISLKNLIKFIKEIELKFDYDLSILNLFDNFGEAEVNDLTLYVKRYEQERDKTLGYLFKKKKIKKINEEFKNRFLIDVEFKTHKNITGLKKIIELFNYSINQFANQNISDKYDFNIIEIVYEALVNCDLIKQLYNLISLNEKFNFLQKAIDIHPLIFTSNGIDINNLKTYYKNNFSDLNENEKENLIHALNTNIKLTNIFSQLPKSYFNKQKNNLENLLTLQMTHMLDGRLINFYQNNKNTANNLRAIIKGKKRFPKEEFNKLKYAFPCILAGIRDYAEYIPFEPNIFDIVIIDEASQVSIAQAFPALLRAKKVLILGDKKQFSNVKSAHANNEINELKFKNVREAFCKISMVGAKAENLKKFNIKTSIMDFFEHISNYHLQLIKYFRGFKEIISYSNEFFYSNLQVMKVRGESIDNVIKFSLVQPDKNKAFTKNTNIAEIEFIISELRKLKDSESHLSVGVITPHTDQQKLLVEKINDEICKDYFYNVLKLKIMTFDSCQGEERDIIFYSMVATNENDHLLGVFPKDIMSKIKEDNAEDFEEKIRVQRLNVGFSRAKLCIHFVLSKPVEDFRGAVKEALQHYQKVIEEAKKEKDISKVDKRSKMEPKVLTWFYQTYFWQKYKNNIEFIPQFDLGKYLKQLDPGYNHSMYKVDFLLNYQDESSKKHEIIIEYDGFKEHFQNNPNVNEYNYEKYYSEGDIYREKILEGYGYKFLRINKFNIGADPVKTLNDRLLNIMGIDCTDDLFIHHINENMDGLANGSKKKCPNCNKVKDADDFLDESLNSGVGRYCNECKKK